MSDFETVKRIFQKTKQLRLSKKAIGLILICVIGLFLITLLFGHKGVFFFFMFVIGCLSKWHKARGFRFPIGWDTNTLGQILFIHFYRDIFWGTILVVSTSVISDFSATDLDQKALAGYFVSVILSFFVLPLTAAMGLTMGGFIIMCLYNGFASGLGWIAGGDPVKSTGYIVTHLIFSWFVFFRLIPLFGLH